MGPGFDQEEAGGAGGAGGWAGQLNRFVETTRSIL